MPTATQDRVVKAGETLSKIAMYEYGDASQWRRIFEANRPKLKDANSIQVGQILKIPAPPAMTGVKPCAAPQASNRPKQRSEMTEEEQLANPAPGLEYPMEFEALELLLAGAALLKGLAKAGIKVLKQGAKKLSKAKNATKVKDVFKVEIDPITGKTTWPNSPYKNQEKDPREIMEEINKKIDDDLKKALKSDKIAEDNAEIKKIHEQFIKTGEWPIRTPQLKQYQGDLPDAGLKAARQKYLDELKKHE